MTTAIKSSMSLKKWLTAKKRKYKATVSTTPAELMRKSTKLITLILKKKCVKKTMGYQTRPINLTALLSTIQTPTINSGSSINSLNFQCSKTRSRLSSNKPIRILSLNSRSKRYSKKETTFRFASSKILSVKIKSTNLCKSRFSSADQLYPNTLTKSLNFSEKKST
jgi:hypothetical protein